MRRHPIVQGEHAVSGQPDVAITTILGSCIAVCLADPVAKLGGMNHFLLGEPGRHGPADVDDLQRYGIHAIEILINALMARGAERSRLRAHLYGGADIIPGLGPIGSRNASFTRTLLHFEGIAITHEDSGGTTARKVEFRPYEGRSLCTRLTGVEPAPAGNHKSPSVRSSGELELFL